MGAVDFTVRNTGSDMESRSHVTAGGMYDGASNYCHRSFRGFRYHGETSRLSQGLRSEELAVAAMPRLPGGCFGGLPVCGYHPDRSDREAEGGARRTRVRRGVENLSGVGKTGDQPNS